MSDALGGLGADNLISELQTALSTLRKLQISDEEPEVSSLVKQVDDLIDTLRPFGRLAAMERRDPTFPWKFTSANELINFQAAVDCTAAIIDDCALFIRPLQSSVEVIAYQRTEARHITDETRLRNQAWYDETSHVLTLHPQVLRALHTAIELLDFQDDPSESAEALKARTSISTRLHFQIAFLERDLSPDDPYASEHVFDAIRVARAVMAQTPPNFNKHFNIERKVKAFFTGREAQLDMLGSAFRVPTKNEQQRFVIYGLGGSGKSELALKFADDYRSMFWGVFFVDGSSRKNAASSYEDVAMQGGVDLNEKAAKHWLSTRALPWLLIIDNVDDEETNLEELLPPGPLGCIIITTRNPDLVMYGNAGERFVQLKSMEPDDAELMLISAAQEPKPWPQVVLDSASAICKALGFLPLALVHAAKAIRNHASEWSTYLSDYDRSERRLRRTLHGRSRSRSRDGRKIDSDNDMRIFSTYEILFEALEKSPKEKCQDAVEILHVFSYLHFQNIRLDVLIDAAINPLKEEEQMKTDQQEEAELHKKLAKAPRKPLTMLLRELRALLLSKLAIPTPLPRVLRNPDGLGLSALEDEVKERLRRALGVLLGQALVSRQDRTTARYSMHPLVHKWVRERPQISTAQAALWCQISLTTLASSIRRPPHGDVKSENRARRELLPHIRHSRACYAALNATLEENATEQTWRRGVPKSYGRLQVEQDVRFSRVYAETGQFREARELQERALSFVSGRLGPDHPIAIMLSLLLTKTVWEMSEYDNATQIQRRATQLCRQTWGQDHPLTLDVSDLLGSALYMKGRWGDAEAIHAANMEKMTALYGEKHEKTLKCMRNLGRLYFRKMAYAEATALYQKSWEGMKAIHGDTHLETLTCLEDLAMSYVRYEEDDPDPNREEHLETSRRRMDFIREERRKELGDEHPYTLLATLHLARVTSAQGHNTPAEHMIRAGLATATRNLGERHIGVIMARTWHAVVLTELGRHAEAEPIFVQLADKAWYADFADEDGDHPDRLSCLWMLVRCLEEQPGRDAEALGRCEELLEGLESIGGNGRGMNHKILQKLRVKMAVLQGKLRETGEERQPLVGD